MVRLILSGIAWMPFMQGKLRVSSSCFSWLGRMLNWRFASVSSLQCVFLLLRVGTSGNCDEF